VTRYLAVVGVLLTVAALLVSCGLGGGEETTPVSPDATFSCSPVPEPEEFPRIRAFAAEVEAALTSGDADFFLTRAVEREMVCTGQEQTGPCGGKEAGTSVKGLRAVVWRSNLFDFMSIDTFREFLSERLGSAESGGLSLYALAYLGSGRFAAITTTLPQGGEKPTEAWLLDFTLVDDSWHLDQLSHVEELVIDDWLSAEALAAAWERCVYWERWDPTKTTSGE